MSRSVGEAQFLLKFKEMAPSGTPMPIEECIFHPDRKWRFDFAWPNYRYNDGRLEMIGGLAVEIDGGQWAPRGGRHSSDGDREKLNQAAMMGWRILRFSPKAIDQEGCRCVEMVVKALEMN